MSALRAAISGLVSGGHILAWYAGVCYCRPGLVLSALGWLFWGIALGIPVLFDIFIGRKRNVDGGVLAARFWPSLAQ